VKVFLNYFSDGSMNCADSTEADTESSQKDVFYVVSNKAAVMLK
jgi:hypothetical protein